MLPCHSRVLHDGPLVRLADDWCETPRSGPGPEKLVAGAQLLFVRRGVYLTHLGADARRAVASEPSRALLLRPDVTVRNSHPTDDGDATTSLRFPVEVLDDVAGRVSRAGAPPAMAATGAAPLLATPALLLPLHGLRRALDAGTTDALAVEETALDLLARAVHDATRARDVRAVRGGASRAGTRRARRALAEAVTLRLAAAPAATPTLAALGRELAASPFHLARVFRAELGVPIHQYLLRLRLNLALARLAEEAVPLSAIALDLGFASHAHFTSTFRRQLGVSPTEARARLCAASRSSSRGAAA